MNQTTKSKKFEAMKNRIKPNKKENPNNEDEVIAKFHKMTVEEYRRKKTEKVQKRKRIELQELITGDVELES